MISLPVRGLNSLNINLENITGRDIRTTVISAPFLSVAILLAVVVVVLISILIIPPDLQPGEFNIAVAEVLVLDENGRETDREDGEALAQWLYSRLESGFSELPRFNFEVQIYPPDYTGLIRGETSENRSAEAEARAQELEAHVVIYGVIQKRGGDRATFTPEFYVHHRGFEEGDEITGSQELGSSLLIDDPFDPQAIIDIENPALSARSEALSLITIGLAYYSIDNFEKSIEYLVQADALEGWFDNAGKEVLYVLLGNAYIRLASRDKIIEPVQAAEESYRSALEIKDDFTRAQVGLASVLYIQALGDIGDFSLENVDYALLDDSETLYIHALETNTASESANIEAKTNLGLGQIYIVKAYTQDGNWNQEELDQAADTLQIVIDEYASGNTQIANMTGHAYARLGLIDWIRGDLERAIEDFKTAVGLVTPRYQAEYTGSMGDLHMLLGRPEEAIQAYTEAMQICEFYGFEDCLEEFEEKISDM